VQIVDDMGIDLDEDIIDKELIELQQESQEHNDIPSHLQCLHSINTQNLITMDLSDVREPNSMPELSQLLFVQC